MMGVPRGQLAGRALLTFFRRDIECEVIFSQALVTQLERVQILLLQLQLMKTL